MPAPVLVAPRVPSDADLMRPGVDPRVAPRPASGSRPVPSRASPSGTSARPARVGALRLPCREHEDADLWFAESGADVERAKALCVPCPIRAACLAGALSRAEPWGVWGGEVFVGGVVVARKRGRGRPRRDAA